MAQDPEGWGGRALGRPPRSTPTSPELTPRPLPMTPVILGPRRSSMLRARCHASYDVRRPRRVEEKFIDVPTTLYQEKIVEVPQVQVAELVRQVPKVEVQEVVKRVAKPVTEVRAAVLDGGGVSGRKWGIRRAGW